MSSVCCPIGDDRQSGRTPKDGRLAQARRRPGLSDAATCSLRPWPAASGDPGAVATVHIRLGLVSVVAAIDPGRGRCWSASSAASAEPARPPRPSGCTVTLERCAELSCHPGRAAGPKPQTDHHHQQHGASGHHLGSAPHRRRHPRLLRLGHLRHRRVDVHAHPGRRGVHVDHDVPPRRRSGPGRRRSGSMRSALGAVSGHDPHRAPVSRGTTSSALAGEVAAKGAAAGLGDLPPSPASYAPIVGIRHRRLRWLLAGRV